jgi:hypothetical protein
VSELSERAVALHRERREQTSDAKRRMLSTRRDVCTRYAAKVLEVPASSLDLAMHKERFGAKADPKTWIFRVEGMDFWVKWVGGKDPCNLYVVSGTDGGLPFRTLEQLGMYINNGHVTVRA